MYSFSWERVDSSMKTTHLWGKFSGGSSPPSSDYPYYYRLFYTQIVLLDTRKESEKETNGDLSVTSPTRDVIEPKIKKQRSTIDRK